ncbi:MAG: EF-hand domain-containing protein [Candidatus Sericytochromatia bacterium]
MKNLKFSLLSLGLIFSFACSNSNTDIIAETQNVDALASKPTAESLIKKLVDKRFTFADKNKDKTLVFSEFKGLESEHEDVMQKMFKEYDKNKDSKLTYEEFFNTDSEGIKSSLNSMFKMLDQNRNSRIDGTGSASEELNIVVEVAFGTATDAGKKVNIEDVKKDYLSFDKDGDLNLTFDEYQTPELKYILMAPVDPYKNSSNAKNPVSMKRFSDDLKAKIKK